MRVLRAARLSVGVASSHPAAASMSADAVVLSSCSTTRSSGGFPSPHPLASNAVAAPGSPPTCSEPSAAPSGPAGSRPPRQNARQASPPRDGSAHAPALPRPGASARLAKSCESRSAAQRTVRVGLSVSEGGTQRRAEAVRAGRQGQAQAAVNAGCEKRTWRSVEKSAVNWDSHSAEGCEGESARRAFKSLLKRSSAAADRETKAYT